VTAIDPDLPRPGPARHRQGGAEAAALFLVAAFAAVLLALPLFLIARMALTEGGGPSLAPLADAFGSASVRRALTNSLTSAAGSAVLATLVGSVLALLVGLTDVRGKGPLIFCILLPMMIPPHVTAIAWIQAVGPGSPVLGALGLAPPPGTPNPLYSGGGVVALLTLQHAPLVFLVLRAALRTLPREMTEAARVAGARPVTVLARIVLPLLAPSLIAAAALAFVSALGNFGIPALLGIPGRFTTLPVLLWQRLSSFGPSMLNDVAVIASIISAIALMAVALQIVLQRRARAVLIGPPQAALNVALGARRPWVEAALWGFVAVTVALPMVSLIATALVPAFGVRLTPATATLDAFREVLFRQSATARAFANSGLVAGGAALTLAALATLTAWFHMRRGPRGRVAGAVTGLADMTYAIPGLVVSIAFILAFIRPLPLIGVSIYGTLGIVLLAYLCAFFAIALKPVTAAFAALDPALDDAARVCGASWPTRLARIMAPLTAPAAASGAILVFLTAYNEITVSALLWSSGNELIGTTIFNYEDGGQTTLAAAMSVLTVLATVALMTALDRMGRRLPPGVVPWR
jgi:iron(III) transport system permease protein